jgi:lambda repressor-like predicted transcriptional regulator
MHPAEIQAALKIRGVKQSDLAASCGVAANTVSAVIHGRSRSQQVEQRIADVIGAPVEQIWPHWFAVPLMQGVAGLSLDERDLLLIYRQLPSLKRPTALQLLSGLLTDAPSGIRTGSHSVVATGDRPIAIGGVHTHSRTVRKKSKE